MTSFARQVSSCSGSTVMSGTYAVNSRSRLETTVPTTWNPQPPRHSGRHSVAGDPQGLVHVGSETLFM